jgi:transposase InsO family protein
MDHAQEFPVEKMCQVFGVSRSGYYRWRKHRATGVRKYVQLDEQIRHVFTKSGRTYGSPRIAQSLQEAQIVVSKSTVARRMNKLKIRVKAPKKYIPTTQSKHDEPVAPNLLQREFYATKPALKWVSDITYFRVNRQWHYLTAVLDLADRYVVGWTISHRLTAASTTQAAFERAVANRSPKRGLIFHSDRGVQYACQDFRQLLERHQCRQSMSRKGNCWDNAVAESFFKTIKTECLSKHRFTSVEEAFSVIFRYIEGWYNTRRIHSSLGNIPPATKYQQLTQHESAA